MPNWRSLGLAEIDAWGRLWMRQPDPQGQDFCGGGPTISRALSPDLVKLRHKRTTQ